MAVDFNDLPPESSPDYYSMAVDAAIAAFAKLQDDTRALDYIGVRGRFRPLILKDEKYIVETRRLKAKMFMEEVDQVEDLIQELDETEPAEEEYDVRNPKQAAEYERDKKDQLNMRLKLMSMRRELLSLNKESRAEEADAVNVYYIAMTREEFEKMQNVEIHLGSKGDDVLVDDTKKEALAKSIKQMVSDEEDMPFFMEADGTLVAMDR